MNRLAVEPSGSIWYIIAMGRNILIVDDELGYRELLAAELSADGFGTFTAAGGHEAAEILGREAVHLVITDMKMPCMDGLDVMRGVKELHQGIPVILMTGYAVEDRAAAALLEARAFLQKPFDLAALKDVVKRAF